VLDRNQHTVRQGTKFLHRRRSRKKWREMGVTPLEDPRASTVSGSSFLPCALSSITHARYTTGQSAMALKSLAATRANPSATAGLGGWDLPRISSKHRAGDRHGSRPSQECCWGLPTLVVPSSFPLCHPSRQGSCRRVQPLLLVGKAPRGARGSGVCPMCLPWDAASLLLHTHQNTLHAAPLKALHQLVPDRTDVCPAPVGGRTEQKRA